MQTYINGSPANPERHMPRTSEVSGNLRLDVLAHQAIHGNPHCYTCGRPMTVQEAIIHRMRDQKRGEPIIPARDAMGICGKCQQVIQITQEMQDPGLSKRQLCRMVRVYYVEKKNEVFAR